MSNLLETLKELNIITKRNQINKQAKRMLEKHPNILQELQLQTKFLYDDTIRVRIYCLMNNITKRPCCLSCGKPMQFNHRKNRFNNYCLNVKGKSCASVDIDLQEKRLQTLVKRYGVNNPRKSNIINEKIRQTNIKKYGGAAPICSQRVKETIKQTCFEKYGVNNPQQNKLIKHKTKQTNIVKYGADTFAQSLMPPLSVRLLDDKQWLIEQFLFKNKSKKRIALELEVSVYSVRKSLNKFNITKDMQVIPNIEIGNATSLLKNKQWLLDQYSNKNMSKTTIANMLNVDISYVQQWCIKHNIEKNTNICSFSTSLGEKEIIDFIHSLDEKINIETSSKSIIPPYEIDIYLPEYNLAIEYCGVYWHSELNGKTRKYHLNKLQRCQEQNIHLIQVWSSEWEKKQSIVKSRIQSFLQKNTTIYARKCNIVEVSSKQSALFLNEAHIQQACRGKIHIGLVYKDALVGIMVFGKNRFNSKPGVELLRYATSLNTNIVGGASKLFNYYIKNYLPNRVVSFSDRRWNKGTLYTNLGFKYSHSSEPNYWYFHRNKVTNKLYSRVAFQKHKLKNKLEDFNPTHSEWKNMQKNGYDRIWDCGNDVFVWTC